MGQQLAKINMPTVIAMLVRDFHLTVAPQVMPTSLSHSGLSFGLPSWLKLSSP